MIHDGLRTLPSFVGSSLDVFPRDPQPEDPLVCNFAAQDSGSYEHGALSSFRYTSILPPVHPVLIRGFQLTFLLYSFQML